MPNQNAKPQCARCAHPATWHVGGNSGKCAKRVPVSWRTTRGVRTPVLGYCKCEGYRPVEAE